MRLAGVFRIFVVFLLCCAVAAVFTWAFLGNIASLLVNNLSGYSLTYDKWGDGLFDRNHVNGVSVRLDDKGIILDAREVFFEIDMDALLKKQELIVECEMKDVSISFGAQTDGAGADKKKIASSNDIASFILQKDQLYKDVSFVIKKSKDVESIYDFKAISEYARISGEYSDFKDKDVISLEVKISLSPQIASGIDENVRKNVLYREDDGWYGTVISYKGNPAFLKAIYSITSSG